MKIPAGTVDVMNYPEVRDWFRDPHRITVLIDGGPDRYACLGERSGMILDSARRRLSVWAQTYYLCDDDHDEYPVRIWIITHKDRGASFQVEPGTSAGQAIRLLAMIKMIISTLDPTGPVNPDDEPIPDGLSHRSSNVTPTALEKTVGRS